MKHSTLRALLCLQAIRAVAEQTVTNGVGYLAHAGQSVVVGPSWLCLGTAGAFTSSRLPEGTAIRHKELSQSGTRAAQSVDELQVKLKLAATLQPIQACCWKALGDIPALTRTCRGGWKPRPP